MVPKYDFECVHRLELPVSSEFWVTKNAYFDVIVLGTLKRFSRWISNLDAAVATSISMSGEFVLN